MMLVRSCEEPITRIQAVCYHAGKPDRRKTMSRLMATAALAFAVLGTAGGVSAQGLVTLQKLSAPLADELVGDRVATRAQKGYAVTALVVELDGLRQGPLRRSRAHR